MEKINILWFKKDLRIEDNEALFEASKNFKLLPIYIIENDLWSQNSYSDRQWQFCKESLIDLNQDLKKLGQQLIIRTGDVIETFEEISKSFKIMGIYSHQETGDYYTYKRDQKIRNWTIKHNIIWKEYLQFAVFRGKTNRDYWANNWKKHLEKKIPQIKIKLNTVNFRLGNIPNDDFFKFKEDKCLGRLKGGRKEGLLRLEIFLKKDIYLYRKNISNPEKSKDNCSRLSPYITWGCLSIREIYKKANFKNDINSKMFKSRLAWHCHFIQKLESEPELEFKEFHSFFNNLRRKNDRFLKLWSEGNTGYPFLDACMRSLNHNGWLNFRMRAMLMSFASYNLWIPWQESGEILAKKFVDYEPGIHWCQCQMQSGTTSINTNRIYNPVKQGKDHDPEGEFIRKWLPELKNVPNHFIHEPWLIVNYEEYKNLNKINYNNPIVDIKETSRSARKKLYKITQKEGYWDISKNVYKKHGSRKSNLRKRIKSKMRKKDQKDLHQFELNLEI